MRALASLIGEHQVIARVVTALEVFVERMELQVPGGSADLQRFVDVFTELGDRIHHEKEENILLPLLSRHGFDWDSGALPAVRREHRQERYLIDVLAQASQYTSVWGREDLRHIAASARALAAFQRAHHRLENEILFPEVALRLDANAKSELQSALERFDREPRHEQARLTAMDLAQELAVRYRPRANVAEPLVRRIHRSDG